MYRERAFFHYCYKIVWILTVEIISLKIEFNNNFQPTFDWNYLYFKLIPCDQIVSKKKEVQKYFNATTI